MELRNRGARGATPVALILTAALWATPTLAASPSNVEEASLSSVEMAGVPLSSDLLIAQAQAPGRPTSGTTQPAPQTPVRDRVAPRPPPPPGTPNFPQRPANEPRPTNPASKK
jgi:hypothetical protein